MNTTVTVHVHKNHNTMSSIAPFWTNGARRADTHGADIPHASNAAGQPSGGRRVVVTPDAVGSARAFVKLAERVREERGAYQPREELDDVQHHLAEARVTRRLDPLLLLKQQ